MSTHTQVVVVGGGYAGVLAANRLTQRDDLDVTLVNPRPVFVERIRLHQLVAGSDDAVVDFADVLAPRVRLVVGSATRLDLTGRRLELADGAALGFDHLVYAVGSGSAAATVPGAAEHAHRLAGLEEAERLRRALDATALDAPVTVVGAGPSGVETAAELAEAGRSVTLVCGEVLNPYLHSRARRAVARRLAALGVRVLAGPGATATAVTPDAVRLSSGRLLPSAVTVWTAGFGVPDLAARSGLRTDALGRLLTDETLTSLNDDRVVAAGDSAAPSGHPFRMSCQAAGPLGAHAADTVLRRIAGEPPAPVALGFLGQCLSLGRGSGVFQLAHRDDTAGPLHLGGRPAARLKELVCWGTVQQLRIEARRPGTYRVPRWATDGGRQRVLQQAQHEAPLGVVG